MPLAWLAVAQILLLAVVALFLMDSDPPENPGDREAPAEKTERNPAIVASLDREETPRTDGAKLTLAVERPIEAEEERRGPKEASAVSRLLEKAVVVVELEDQEGRRIRDTRGVLVHPDGVVLCRHAELAGAYRGQVRLGLDSSKRVTIAGIMRHDLRADLALLRLDLVEADLPALPIVESPPAEIFSEDDFVFVSSGQRARRAEIELANAVIAGEVGGILLERARGMVPEMFLAVEPIEGAVIGLCRPVVEDGFAEGGAVGVGRSVFSLFVDPAYLLVESLELPVAMDLAANTREFFEGSFADLLRRGSAAFREKRFNQAVELLGQALTRGQLERVEETQLEEVSRLLRESYLAEISRLREAKRYEEAASFAGAAIELFGDDAVLWFYLGEIRLEQGLSREAIGAFLEVRRIEGTKRVDDVLEVTYRKLAADLLQSNDARQAELVYLDGVDQLPGSGILRFELGRLYLEWEALGDATRLLQEAAVVDPGLKDQAELLLEKIDDLLARRDAVIIPIPENSRSIRAEVVVDGRIKRAFVIDTGATFTAISSDFAEDLGYDLKVGPTAVVTTAGGRRRVRVIKLVSASLGGYTVRNLEAYVLPAEVGAGTNLLGLNFLNFFKYSVNSKRREFRLERL